MLREFRPLKAAVNRLTKNLRGSAVATLRRKLWKPVFKPELEDDLVRRARRCVQRRRGRVAQVHREAILFVGSLIPV